MKILAVGAGSMGRRRLRDLLALEAGEVVLYEPQADRCYEIAARFGLRGFTDFEKALAEKPDAMTVSISHPSAARLARGVAARHMKMAGDTLRRALSQMPRESIPPTVDFEILALARLATKLRMAFGFVRFRDIANMNS